MSNILRKYGIFLIIPGIVLTFSVLLKLAAGPYWLDPNIEGPYTSLVNGLDILKGYVPDDTTHPSTPLQILCCVVFWLSNMGRSAGDAVTRVLISPEFYLHRVFAVLVLFSFFTSVALAVFVFRKTGDRLAAALAQLPALSYLVLKIYPTVDPVIPIAANVGSEPLLFSIVNLFNIGFLKYFLDKTEKDRFFSTLFWGFVCGWGVAEKLTFIPLIVVPLLILSWKNRMLFICIFAASFFMWTLPILSKYPVLWNMIKSYSLHGGVPGHGNAIQLFCSNWKNIIIQHWMLAGFMFAALLLVFGKFAGSKWERASFCLLAVSVGVLVQFSAVAVHPGPQYLMPGLGLFSSLLVLFYLQGPGRDALGRRIILIFVLAFIITGVCRAVEYRSHLAKLMKDIRTFNEYVHAKYQGCMFVNYYRSSGQEFALFLGDQWEGSPRLREEMYRIYPNRFFLNRGSVTNRIVSFEDRVFSNDLLARSSCVLFQGDDLYGPLDLRDSALSVRLLEKGRMESVYLLTGTTEKQAAMFFAAAAHSFEAGDYMKALKCALQAKAFHYQPRSDVDTFINFIAPYAARLRQN